MESGSPHLRPSQPKTMFKNLKEIFSNEKESSNLHPKIREYFSQLGKKGGSSSSEAKRLACIENGKKGGRPKKVQNSFDPKRIGI